MTENARNEKIVAGARAGLGPTPAEAARVRRVLDAAIAATAGTGSPVRSLPLSPGRWSRLLMASTLAASTGAVGYWVGFRAGRRAIAGASAASLPARRPPHVTSPPVAVVSAAPVAAFGGISPVPLEPTARLSPPTSHARRADAAVGAGAPAISAESLDQEVKALRSVERALRDGQPYLALALLRELDRTVPRARLVEEREATSAIARCASGEVPLGLNLAEDFAERYPDSVYIHRVEQACQAPSAGSGRARR